MVKRYCLDDLKSCQLFSLTPLLCDCKRRDGFHSPHQKVGVSAHRVINVSYVITELNLSIIDGPKHGSVCAPWPDILQGTMLRLQASQNTYKVGIGHRLLFYESHVVHNLV